MNLETIVGLFASLFIGLSLIPQLIKLLKEKRGDQISMGMLSVLIVGQILWVIYGVMKQDWIIIVSNSFSALINLAIIVLSIKYKQGSNSAKAI